MHFGMPTLIENDTLQDNIALCTRLGLRFIELNMNFPEYQIAALEDTETLLLAAEKAGIYYTIHLDENLNIADFNPLVTEAYLETVRRAIFAARPLLCLDRGGRQPFIINMHLNHGIHITLPDRKVQMYERNADVYTDAVRRFRRHCEEWIDGDPIRISIENTEGFRSYEQTAVDELLKSSVFGLTWDIGHSKAEKESDLPFIMARRDRLCHFHIHDGREEPPANHLALGDGEIDLSARLELARECGARCVLETKTAAALEKSVRWLDEKGYRQDKE